MPNSPLDVSEADKAIAARLMSVNGRPVRADCIADDHPLAQAAAMGRAEAATYPKPEAGWTCFHCGETFTTPGAARDHFGFDPSCDPACRIKIGAERGLVIALRKAEQELGEAWQAIHSESTEAAKAYHAQNTRHRAQLMAVEEAGYERGLGDGMPPTKAAIDVLAERSGHVEREGWTPEHDDEHGAGEMAAAAAAYAFSAATSERYLHLDPIGLFPWGKEYWKPKSPREDLVRAGSLILAEIERIDRAGIRQHEADEAAGK